MKVVITGGAGLVGQNLLTRMAGGEHEIVVIDKNAANAAVIGRFHPAVKVVVADMADPGPWEDELDGCDTLVQCQAQIGGLVLAEFERNNIRSTELILAAAADKGVGYVVHLSSSVVNSLAVDYYTETKKAQERLVDGCPIPHVVLRPTLMFGWFDRKHIGWLARFMKRVPVFPIPGDGRFLRQPLYVGDFCNVILASIDRRATGTFDITGQERIDYIDLMRAVRQASGAKATIVTIPYRLFWLLLRIYALASANPPFTTNQLKALVTPDVFPVIDWPGTFGVAPTPFAAALEETFGDPRYSDVVLQF